MKSKFRYDHLDSYSDYDHLMEMPVSPQAQEQYPHFRKTWKARLLFIPSPKGESKGFITSCLCPEKYALKNSSMFTGSVGKIERSDSEHKPYQLVKKPLLSRLKSNSINQELWGILTSYNIIGLEMVKQHKVEPLRISFINAFYRIQDELIGSERGSPGTILKR